MISNRLFILKSISKKNQLISNNNSLFKKQYKNYSSKKHNTNFDYNLDWIINSYFTNKFTLTNIFFLINTGIFAYCWLRFSKEGRYKAQDNLSYSEHNLNRKDYINLFASALGDRKIDDYIIHSTIFLTVVKKLEKKHGSPFVFKMILFSFYIALLCRGFWTNSKYARNNRYLLEDYKKKEHPEFLENKYKYGSSHAICMPFVYFYMYKTFNPIFLIPLIVVDLKLWGLVESSPILTGVAAGMIL